MSEINKKTKKNNFEKSTEVRKHIKHANYTHQNNINTAPVKLKPVVYKPKEKEKTNDWIY